MRIVLAFAPLALAACVRPAAPVEEAPTPAPPVPRAVPIPVPAPIAVDWRDWPRTPGTWSYRRDAAGSVALYGVAGDTPRAALRCDRASRRLTLSRGGAPTGALTVRTSSVTRAVPVTQAAGGDAGPITASLSADDRLLDAMAYSRGRFTIEAPPNAALSLPAWAEVARVIEDCR